MNEIIQGDCLEVMKTFPDNYFSGIVTDPPYGLHFMGKDWDKFTHTALGDHRNTRKRNGSMKAGAYYDGYNEEFQRFIFDKVIAALRILKPGGYVLMFGAPRRYHRQIIALEDAGFEIRDCLMWVFGSGFPKSHNHFGLEGYGTALKPAYEPIIMAMKPIEGTFKQNAEKWGQAGINIDGCRVGSSPGYSYPNGKGGSNFFKGLNPEHCPSSTKGRWPANLILDEEAGAMLDQQSGVLKSGREDKGNKTQDGGYGKGYGYIEQICQPSQGGASRFFYCAKTSSRERNEGLNLDPQAGGFKNGSGRGLSKSDPNKEVKYKNNHPTVKPLALMRYLITLISPPTNALILDPFAGSGSTIVAAHQLGIKAIGIEKQSQYCEIARARVAHAKKLKFQDNPQMEMFG